MRTVKGITLLSLTLLSFGLVVGPTLSAAPAPPCDPMFPSTCLYVSDLSFPVFEIEAGVVDPARNEYPIPLLIRVPVGAPGPRPVVIWNHGGNPSPNGRTRSARWGAAMAEAGYVVIHPSRTDPANPLPYRRECRDNGVPILGCAAWIATYRFGPQNTHFLLNSLAQIQQLHPVLTGLLDPTRIVVGGHSAGSTVALANAGAWQQFVADGTIYDEFNAGPMAFLISGPQGPDYVGFGAGFQSASYESIDGRPFMFISGFGDSNHKPSETRVTPWLRSTAGGKYLSWDTENEAVHETMAVHKCDTPLRAEHCDWIESAGLAFLDAIVRGRQEAVDWLGSDNYSILSGGAIELHRR